MDIKIHLIIIALSILMLIGISSKHIQLPPILLHKGAQHNTLGELPVVEVMDDGDFYEKDEAEYYYNYRDECIGSLTEQCSSKMTYDRKGRIKWIKRNNREKDDCIFKVTNECSMGNIPRCEVLDRLGLMWTCRNIGWE